MTKHKVGPKDYYDCSPSSTHSPGDIWSDVPTFGLLRDPLVTGLVITPACDLSNSKVETITYLPVVSVASYFVSPAFLPEISREAARQLAVLGATDLLAQTGRFEPPSTDAIDATAALVTAVLHRKTATPKETSAATKSLAGLRLLRAVAVGQPTRIMSDASVLFGDGAVSEILSRVVRNSYRLDIHFLPPDDQILEWSGVATPSVVLFRYTLTAPASIFEAAHDGTLKDWPAAVAAVTRLWPAASAFAGGRPLKRVSLRPHFLGDLLTRYVAMYVRLGSPDFTAETTDEYVAAIKDRWS